MALITWNDTLSLHIDAIDQQHKKLVDMINEFYDSLSSKKGNDNIGDLLRKMKDYTVVHFNYEESLLRKSNYPDLVNHQATHKSFVDKVNDIEQRHKAGKLVVSMELTSFLKDWLISHIQGTDRRYASHLKGSGL
ncbi:MAG: bacteriohemerythrin [Bacteroidales bacterium]